MLPEFRQDGWLPEGHHQTDWDELIARFGDSSQRRRELTTRLLWLRDALRGRNISGTSVLNGSYISAKEEPGDFDALLISPANIQVRKEADPELARLLDAEAAEKVGGYSLFYLPENSSALSLLRTLWDISNQGVPKGVVEVLV